MYTLFLDDERIPAFRTDRVIVVCRTFQAFCDTIRERGMPVEINFDHDLGEEKTGLDAVQWLLGHMVANNVQFPNGFSWFVHSQNPVGARNINQQMEHLTINLHRYQEAYQNE